MLLGCDTELDGTAYLLAHILYAVKGLPYVLGRPAAIKLPQVGQLRHIPSNAKATAEDTGHAFCVQMAFFPAVVSVAAFVVETGMGHLCGDGGKGFIIREAGGDEQGHLLAVIIGGRIHAVIHYNGDGGIVEQGGQGGFHILCVIGKLRCSGFPALGLPYVISLGDGVPFPEARTGENLETVAFLAFHNGTAHRLPALAGAKLCYLRVLGQGQRHIAHTVHGVVSLGLQIAGIGVGVAGNRHNARVLQGHKVFPVCLTLGLPFLVVLCLARYDIC